MTGLNVPKSSDYINSAIVHCKNMFGAMVGKMRTSPKHKFTSCPTETQTSRNEKKKLQEIKLFNHFYQICNSRPTDSHLLKEMKEIPNET